MPTSSRISSRPAVRIPEWGLSRGLVSTSAGVTGRATPGYEAVPGTSQSTIPSNIRTDPDLVRSAVCILPVTPRGLMAPGTFIRTDYQ